MGLAGIDFLATGSPVGDRKRRSPWSPRECIGDISTRHVLRCGVTRGSLVLRSKHAPESSEWELRVWDCTPGQQIKYRAVGPAVGRTTLSSAAHAAGGDNMRTMTFAEAVSAIAQGAVNITEGLTIVEPGSRIHTGMLELCRLLSEGAVTRRDLLAQRSSQSLHRRSCNVGDNQESR